MDYFDVLVVGGGPAGSSCARRLVEGGLEVAVLDREPFPRTKLCAGWITPQVVEDLELDIASYPHRFNTFDHIVVHLKGFTFALRAPQHSIRRFEFDDFLLRRSQAKVLQHTVKDVREGGRGYVVDERFECRHIVGAGGTRCPVHRSLFRDINPRARELQAATLEHELPYPWSDGRCHLWFFDNALPGYSWYVPKADGYLNCGIGAMAQKLKARSDDIKAQWAYFAARLETQGLVKDAGFDPRGYSYYLRGSVEHVRRGNAFLCGDAAGLATRDLCEGIGPAIRSGERAARSILTGAEYRLDDLDAFSADRGWVRWLLEKAFIGKRLG
jgi:flavin-dependent dehydrogenase